MAIYNYTLGTNVTGSLDDVSGVLTISGTGDMFDPWDCPFDSYKTSVTSVIINSGVTSIGRYTFYGFSNLVSISIPNTITTINSYAFLNCSNLESFTFPNSVINVYYNVLYGCDKLTTLVIGNSMTEIPFLPNSAVKYITLGSSISYFDYNLHWLSELTAIYVDSNSIYFTSLGGVLFNKDTTTILKYPKGISNTNYSIPITVTTIAEAAFRSCAALTSITIPSTVTTIGPAAFSGCIGLTSVTLPESLIKLDDSAFSGCIGLTSIIIPNSVTTVGLEAFSRCSSLESVYVGSSVTSLSFVVFYDCPKLATINVDDNNQHLTDIDGVVFSKDLTTLFIFPAAKSESYVVPQTVTNIGESAFYNSIITFVELPKILTSISDFAFYSCSNLTSIIIPNTVGYIGYRAFERCENLKSITNLYAGNQTLGYSAFSTYATGEKTVYTFEINTNFIAQATEEEYSIKYLLGYYQLGSNIYGTLYSEGLLEITGTGESFDYLGEPNSRPFDGESNNIKIVTLGEGITSIGNYMFYYQPSLRYVVISNTVSTIGEYAFGSCPKLNSITNLYNGNQTLEFEAFSTQATAVRVAVAYPSNTNFITMIESNGYEVSYSSLKTRHRKLNSNGVYDLLHVETDADQVVYDNNWSMLDSRSVQSAIDEINNKKASIDSPSFIGVPTAPTAQNNNSSTQIATTEFVKNEIADLEEVSTIIAYPTSIAIAKDVLKVGDIVYSTKGNKYNYTSDFRHSPWSYNASCAAFSPDGKLLVVGGELGDGYAKLYSVNQGLVTFITQIYADNNNTSLGGTVNSVAFSPNGSLLILGGQFSGYVKVYSINGNSINFISNIYGNIINDPLPSRTLCIEFSSDGNRVILGGGYYSGFLKIYSISGTNITFVSDIYTDSETSLFYSDVISISLSSDNTKLVVGGRFQYKAKLYNVSGTTVTFITNIYSDSGYTELLDDVLATAISPDSSIVVIGGKFPGYAKIYSIFENTITYIDNLYANNNSTNLSDHVYSTSISSDGNKLILGGFFDRSAKVYSLSGSTATFVADFYSDSNNNYYNYPVTFSTLSSDDNKLILGGNSYSGITKYYDIIFNAYALEEDTELLAEPSYGFAQSAANIGEEVSIKTFNASNVFIKHLGRAYAPVSHIHGNITSDGAIGSTSGLMVKTTTSGVLTTLAAGSSGQFLQYDGTWATPPASSYSATNGVTLNGTTFEHVDTSSVTNMSLGGANVLSTVNFDTFGHVISLTNRTMTYTDVGAAASSHTHGTYDNSTALTGANVYSNVQVTDGIVTGLTSRALGYGDVGAAASSHNHGNITSDGKIGTVAGNVAVTTTNGVLTALVQGTTSQYLRGDGTWATPPDTNTTYTNSGTGLNLVGTTFSHADTSTQTSVNNSGRTYIQDITLDEFGHITALASATETVTDTTYTAGNGLGLSGTTFSLDMPGTLSASSTNAVTADSHTHAITTSSSGAVSTIVATDAGGNISIGNVTAASLKKSGGTSSQFLKADGSVDSSAYVTSAAIGNGTLSMGVSGTGLTGSATFYANDGTGITTFTVSSNANASNGASTIVARDATGNFASNQVTVNKLVKSGGTSGQFLKADGSVDSTTYLPSSSYSASDVLTKIKTVDGTGSGLDADLLDGLNSTDFEPANSNIQSHISDTLNPHGVTISQIGAEPANANIQTHISSTSNPHSVTATQVGLGNVTNESKATMFTNPTFTGTVSGITATMVGLGNVTNESKATMFTSPTFTGTVSGITASMVGLGNVTNESKETMFTSPTFTGTVTIPTTNNFQFNSFGVGTAASGTAGEIRATNNVTAYYSDERLKDFHGTIPNALEKVLSLNGYYFTANEIAQSYGYDSKVMQVGISAQEIEKVLPEVVTDAPIGDGYKTVWYEKIVPLLIEAIKEQQKQIEELKELIGK